MNKSTTIKIKTTNNIERKLKKLHSKHGIVLALIEKSLWLDNEKREAIKMMVNIFMEFAVELAKKKGVK
ncbi:hypothetical protein MLC52_10895 [Sulfurimonas sp. NW15]|uniref:hypothetical protein n=1 Tax=Sulfurimonas sp. NW15 TaxID=2922729 RepID=UPI003DA8E9BE